MYPILLRLPFALPFIGPVTIHTYGLLVALAFLTGLSWVTRESKQQGEDPAIVSDLMFYVIVTGIIGGRLTFMLVEEPARFFGNPLTFFRIWEGGLVFYGGVILSNLFGIWFTRRHGMSYLKMADIFAPALALGHAIGRVGCLMAGCCYGQVVGVTHWWTLTFPTESIGAPPGLPLYPTQPLESLGELVIFSVLYFARRHKRFNGQIFALYLMMYAVLRGSLETLRGDVSRGFVPGTDISTSQAISAVMILLALGIWIVQSRRVKRSV